jgi:hypothetical protein
MLEAPTNPSTSVRSSMKAKSDGTAIGPPWQSPITSRQLRCSLESDRMRLSDGTANGVAHMGDDTVHPGLRHCDRLIRREHIGEGEQSGFPSDSDHVDFALEAETRRFKARAKFTLDPGDGGKVYDAGEAEIDQFTQEMRHFSSRIGCKNARDNRSVAGDRQDLPLAHFLDDGVGVADR